jgi:hypothetical protein
MRRCLINPDDLDLGDFRQLAHRRDLFIGLNAFFEAEVAVNV